MLVIGLLGAVFATAALALFVLRLAGIALPLWVGLASFFAALHRGIDPLLSAGAAVLLGVLTLVAGQIVFAQTRLLALRAIVAAAFVIPAGIAGYHVAADIVSLTSASLFARLIAGISGAIAVSWAALQHLIGAAHVLGAPARRTDAAGTNRGGTAEYRLAAAPQERGNLS